ncbi:YceI family protein [Patescibacteria group bacterium]|nr:YceI family protein [Patescibacteria group bacterium]
MKKLLGIIILVVLVILVLKGFSKNNTSSTPLPRNELQQDAAYQGDLELEDGDYTVATEKSSLVWSGKTPLRSHTGTVDVKDGNLLIVNGTLTGSVVFDMNSITSDSSAVDNDLKSKNFFEVETYPTAFLDIEGYTGGNIEGYLTIKGVTQPVSLPVSIIAHNDTVTLSGKVSIDRTLWGVEYRSGSVFSGLGDKAIDDDINLDVTIIATH